MCCAWEGYLAFPVCSRPNSRRGVPGALRGFYLISMVEVETRISRFLEVKRPDAITTII